LHGFLLILCHLIWRLSSDQRVDGSDKGPNQHKNAKEHEGSIISLAGNVNPDIAKEEDKKDRKY